jgi:hypothetical protein
MACGPNVAAARADRRLEADWMPDRQVAYHADRKAGEKADGKADKRD